MTDRLADIGARIEGIRQLGGVVNAMCGIAAARAVQARGQMPAVEDYAAMILVGIGRILPAIPARSLDASGPATRPAIVVFCAEQGFAGAFSERVLDAVGPDLATSELFLVGSRGATAAAERGLVARWSSAMPSIPEGIPRLADRIADALYALISAGEIDSLDVVFSRWQPRHGIEVERRRLIPLDTSAVSRAPHGSVPLTNLSPDMLLLELTADYLYAQLCATALHAFAAENEARMEAMAAARSQIERRLSALQATQRQVRQQEITAEIIELAAGETASRDAGRSAPPR